MGDYESRCIGVGVVVALVRAFVRPISEMKGEVENERHVRGGCGCVGRIRKRRR